MKPATIVACLALFGAAIASEEGHGVAFCYRDAEGCGPSTSAWNAAACHEGQRQSPVDLPANLRTTGSTHLRLISAYKGSFFRMQNSGHSVAIDFVGESGQNEGPTSQTFSFPDPLNLNQRRDYKFASAHFHWGRNNTIGSEHTVGGKSTSLEAHFVHYLANYSTLGEAVASGDESALNVLGLFIDVSRVRSFFGRLTNMGSPSLAPIVKNLDKVVHASHDGGFVTVNQPLDFTNLILPGLSQQVYTYKGSLTTPGCNEQVNWFVLKNPATVPASDLEAFRSIIQDSNGDILNENHRPTLALNGRKVSLNSVTPTA